PADGKPLPGYELARAEVLANGGTVAGYTAVASAEEAGQPRRKSFWATLFGGADEDEDEEEIRLASRPGRALLASARGPETHYASEANSSVYAALQPRTEPRTQGSAARPAP